MSFDLDEYQQSAWELFLSGKNVALFGRAGCSKSAVLSRAIDYAQRVHGATGVGVMAWTSQAASLINGMTFHKFLAIGIAELPKEVILEKLEPVVQSRTLVQEHLTSSRAFRDTYLKRHGSVVFLRGSHRQVNTAWFLQFLDRVRVGTATEADIAALNATSAGVSTEQWNSHTQLRALNRDVNDFNLSKLAALPGPEIVYYSRDELNDDIKHSNRRAYATRCLTSVAPPSVAVKPGAVVLLTRPVDGIPSATQGVITACKEDHISCLLSGRSVRVPLVGFDVIDNCNVRLATRFALPVILAWDMTIHRAQGSSLDSLAVDFTNLRWRQPGLVYTGLSRCRSFNRLLVRGLRLDMVCVCDSALSFEASHCVGGA